MVFSLLILTAAFAAVTAQKPKCLITAPSIVHLGVEETVTVQLHGATKPVTIMLYFRLQKGSKRLSEMKTIVLNDQNDYQSVVKLRVDPRLYDKPQRVPYVQLVASGEDVFQKPQPININLSAKNGFLFIQTDKPIYNPGETAKFRVFTLDNYMLPIDEIINVQIFNAKGLKVHSHNLRSGHVLSRSVVLPDVEPAGHWKILAFFVKYPMSNSSVEFEVREYVLPSFEVKIEAPRPYHTLRNQAFQFRVTARYTYGQGVSGTAYARFGLTDEKGDRTFLPGIEKQTQISDGAADMTLATAELQAAAESRGIPHIERMTLYIAVTVLEKASGDLEDAESTSVRIVTSPYIIDLSRTKEYFSPEGMFSILATTTHPDGSRVPALTMRASVTVHLQGSAPKTLSVKGFGDAKGDAVLSFEVPKLATSMDIMVFAESEQEEVILSDAKMTANAVTATYGSYLSIEVQPHVLLPKQALTISFRDITPPGAGRPSHIYYMILSKGRVIQVSRVETHDLTSVSLPYSTDLVPSLRIVAYYYVEQQGDTSIVTDSVWIDVKDACRGQVEIASLRDHKPAEVMKVVVQSDPASKVALVAVDKAVYILNNQNKLTPRKMFDRMDSYDLACSVGGGEDHKSVFQDAGLTFLCNCEIAAGNLEVCNRKRTREKRDLHQEISRIVNRYWNPDRRCCSDGAKPAPLKRSCHDRHKRTAHQTPRCRETFLKCCLEATEVRKRYSKSRRVSLGRVLSSEMENALDEASIHIRSFFPQSWMWVVLDTDPSGHVRYDTAVPDSITTWEVQAVSLSPTTGFCVAEPKELRVFQDFFVSVKLPYSVKKNEQLEVKAIVYNYKEEELQVTVEMEKVEGLCSAGGGAVKEEITVPGNSARSVYFIVVPLVIGNIPITVLARSSLDVQDKIQKELQVVGEGEIVHLQSEFSINAEANAKLEIEIADPLDEVPGRHSTTTMSIRGGVMGESVDNCLNLEGIDKLIQLPTGCAEQTMVKMSPAVHSTRYLDATDQWLPLKAERRDEAIHMVQAGYNTVLTHKKPDGSYGAFLSTPSSVWLTAFIAKELTESRDLINVEDSYIQESVSYLISKQTSSGAFNDPNPLYDRNMKGGIGVSEGDVPLTAFILISMKHALQTYDSDANTAVLQAMAKASSYLEKKLMTLQDAFGLAITAYALSLTNSRAASTAHSMLWQMATCDEGKGTCHWVVGKKADASTGLADSISVETTAYGLLLALTVDDKEMATSIAKWLTEQRKFGGGFRSTQDTVVALEALAKFSTQSNDVEYLDLHIEMCLQDGHKETINLTRSNALTQTAVEVRQGGKVSIRVEGKGNGTLSILQSYRSLKKPDLYCDHLHIEVSVTGDVQYGESEDTEPELDDYYNYDTAEDIQRDEPSHRMAWFDLQSRRKRQAPLEPEKEGSLTYTVCLGMKMGESTGMMMVDISLLSGLTPIIQDLEDITKGTEKYIDNYGVDHNKVYLYFHKITDQIECLQFRAKQIVPMGLVQPAAAVIYEYYNPERRCGVFYGAPAQTNMISKLCDGDVCTCAEGHCPKPKVTFSKNMDHTTRNKFACYSPVVNYVYTMEVLNNTDDGVFQYYKTLVTEVLQTGKDAAIQKNAVRTMIQRKACSELTINIGAQYLIMGKDESVSGADRDFRYIMDNKMWIEEIPAEGKCKATKSRKACNLLHDFISQYLLKHCA